MGASDNACRAQHLSPTPRRSPEAVINIDYLCQGGVILDVAMKMSVARTSSAVYLRRHHIRRHRFSREASLQLRDVYLFIWRCFTADIVDCAVHMILFTSSALYAWRHMIIKASPSASLCELA